MIRCARATSVATIGSVDRLVVVWHRDPAGEQRLDAVLDQEVVLEADQEARFAGIALAPGAAAQLQVDAAALVPVRADDIEAAEAHPGRRLRLPRPPPSLMSVPRPAMFVEIVTAPRAPAPAMIRASASSFFAFSTAQATPAVAKRVGHPRGLLDGQRADQHRPAGGVSGDHLGDDGALLRGAMREDDVRSIDANQRPVRRESPRPGGRRSRPVRRRRRGRCRSSRTGGDSCAGSAAA